MPRPLRPPGCRFARPVLLLVWMLFAPHLAAQEVQLPLDRYEALREQAEPAPVVPVPVALERARLELTVHGDHARLIQELEISLLSEGWRRIALPAVGRYLTADLGELEGFLSHSSDDRPRLHVRGRGRHRIRLEAVLPVDEDDRAAVPTRRITLELPAAAVLEGTLVDPRARELTVEGGLAEATESGWTWFGPPGGRVVLELRSPDPTARQQPADEALRFETLSATAVEVGRTRTAIEVWMEHRVLSGRLAETSLALPGNLELLAVETEPPADWETVSGTLVMRPVQPVEDRLHLRLRFNAPAGGSAFTLPSLPAHGTLRHRAWARLQVSGAGLARLQPAAAVEEVPAPPAELPAPFRQAPGPLLRLEDPANPPTWQLLWSEGVEVLAVDIPRLRADVVAGEDGRALVQLWIEVRSRGGRQLRMTPPVGFQPLRGTRDGRRWTPAADALDLLWPLTATGDTTVLSLTGFLPLTVPEKGPLSVPLPAFSAPVRQVEMRLLLPGGRRYQLEDSSRQGWVEAPPEPPPPPPVDPLSHLLGARSAELGTILETPIPGPPGFLEVHATWSALDERPTPLRLDVDDDSSRPEWF